MKRAAIAAHGLRSGALRRHPGKAIPLLIVLVAPALGACSLSPVETAATSPAAAPAAKEPARARKHAVALAKADPREKECLVRAMYFESNRSSETGLLGVGTVVMNRVESARYPETICGVVGAPRQFAAGVLTRPMTDNVLPKVEAIAEDILNGRRNEAVGVAKHFHMAGLRFGYKNMHYVTVAGGNAFYVKGERPERRRIEEPTIQLASATTSAPPASFASAPLAFAPEAPAPRLPALETPVVTLITNAPLPPGRPLDLDLPRASVRAFVAQPGPDRRLALLPASEIRGGLSPR
ncbi:cell wall hydrolase [Bosea sp. (in: a-proteobacteria)]|uniref:cell wall hydrolase n=1 Tax=Bosea sp. (in: a-proteobacteria) TaxID=1871050 RepID=UPI00261C07D9|nr:cell wall hydrolase [Bosea sp. (in: a-proteobacteria)]MCO5090869.1 cell wall hydrolase [Bosea sp. (in: a-proteobacteria)]